MQSHKTDTGCLFIVATPIGNLGDFSARAIETLSNVDLIAAEDTRRTGALLTHLGIKKKMLSLHSHNEAMQLNRVISELQAGQIIALVSDAGTPLISDPGFPLVREARKLGIPVVPIPGASAVITALSIAGLSCERFAFEGFLPAKKSARRQKLEQLKAEQRTLVFYESPHRISAMMADVSAIFGMRNTFIARELTKIYEQTMIGSPQECLDWLAASDDHRKGEFVVVIEGEQVPPQVTHDEETVLRTLLKYLSVKDASRAASQILGQPRKQLYQHLLALSAK
ncbi:MAG TPA: 16S rRNA (cytidine(1402)-2'-O)-methyltransferase [Candidatus Tenderia electrophaga]|uniref:Ribosomal RNA small subunit methyltransferase I n=1 Tax=Candidatus Tenderia electrophaga TaxID=1748243 RepID=A0A832J7B6_9GAMM|nr:16S rRNA (cytidine(1402)-2'-O)-methyltransferase [Candidatus Tenderia electrophaga]